MKKSRKAAKNFSNRSANSSTTESFADMLADVECSADAEASLTTPIKASALRKNGHVMLHGNPCKIIDLATSRPGKHGHAKVHIVGLDLFTGRKYEDISPSAHTIEVPVSSKQEFVVVDMGREGTLALLDDNGVIRHDITVTDEDLRRAIADKLAKQDDQDITVTVLRVMDKELVMSVKTGIK